MTIDEKFGTTIDTPHRERYGAVVNLIGLEKFERMMPCSTEELAEYIKKDPHLNNISIKVWDCIAGNVSCVTNSDRQQFYFADSELKKLLRSHQITCYSPAQLVCILKEAAKELVEEMEAEKEEQEEFEL